MTAIVYGHRGASIELPENTLEAFQRALELGADAIETDVHVTSDGHVVIHHDDTGARMACARRAVAECSLEEVQRWNVGFGFRDRRGAGISDSSYRAPTLEEALAAFGDVRFNIDIKTHRAVDSVLRVVERAEASDRVLLTSFHDDVTRAIRLLGYRGRTGLARGEALRALALPAWAPRAVRPAGDHIQLPVEISGVRLARPRVIRRLQALGYRVDFWVINDPRLAIATVAAGADGVMTDDPRTIVPAVHVENL